MLLNLLVREIFNKEKRPSVQKESKLSWLFFFLTNAHYSNQHKRENRQSSGKFKTFMLSIAAVAVVAVVDVVAVVAVVVPVAVVVLQFQLLQRLAQLGA